MISPVSDDTKAALLLYHTPEKWPVRSLTLKEYNELAVALSKASLRPGDLLKPGILEKAPDLPISASRLRGLLEGGAFLAGRLDEWQRAGFWIISRGDREYYPGALLKHLGFAAPPLLYGIGNPQTLASRGLAIVGSRSADGDALAFVQSVARKCAEKNVTVISGGAKGVDTEAMLACLENGGSATGIMSEGLLNSIRAKKWRDWLGEDRLTLVSPYPMDSRWTVRFAMERNKYIYGMSEAALVACFTEREGGTWAGAREELKRETHKKVFVRSAPNEQALLKLGAELWDDGKSWELAFPQENLPVGSGNTPTPVPAEEPVSAEPVNPAEPDAASPQLPESQPDQTAYEYLLPLLLRYTAEPVEKTVLLQKLDVAKGQLDNWLKRAVQEGKIVKIKKDVYCVANQAQGSLEV